MERAAFLTGEFRHALDERARIAIPVRFRPRLAQGATLARWLDGCLAVFPADTWEDLAERIQALPTTNAAARQFGRFMSSGAVDVELDRQGRLLVPSYLREYAALTANEVVVVGALNRLEIWAPERWQPYRSQIEDQPEALAEHLADLGI
jgi:MraZ protein